METPRLINTYDQLVAAGGGIAITLAWNTGRDTYITGWNIMRVGADGKQLVADPKAHWTHNGAKHFSSFSLPGKFHERQAAALEQAKAWVAEKYGEQGPWVRNAMKCYVPERINKQFPLPKRTA